MKPWIKFFTFTCLISATALASVLCGQSATATVAPPALELRGIIVGSDGPRFNFFDERSATSRWVRLHDTLRGYRVEEFRAEKNAVVLKSSQRTLLLVLAAGKGVESAPILVSAAVQRIPDFSASTEPLVSLPADQQQKLNELAVEVRRRQAARQASGDPTGP